MTNKQKNVKKLWRLKMKRKYPGFTIRRWAKESYRIAHPQSFN